MHKVYWDWKSLEKCMLYLYGGYKFVRKKYFILGQQTVAFVTFFKNVIFFTLVERFNKKKKKNNIGC